MKLRNLFPQIYLAIATTILLASVFFLEKQPSQAPTEWAATVIPG